MADKRALVVGIDTYEMKTRLATLFGAVKDATQIADLLETHDDGSPNWAVFRMIERPGLRVEREPLDEAINEFFQVPRDEPAADLLFYFSGHARRRGSNTELMASDGAATSFAVLMLMIQSVKASSVTVILDCCTSGALANEPQEDPFLPEKALVLENVTILTASRPGEKALEHPDRGGLFSEAIRGGLRGAAADLLGNVTALSLYAHASGAFGEDEQRPTFKSHAVRPRVLRRVEPQVPPERLAEITRIFRGRSTAKVVLTKEHEGDPADPLWTDRKDVNRKPYTGTQKQIELDHLKAYRDANLLRSDDGRDFWFLCEEEDPQKSTVSLTPLGRYFWDLVTSGRLKQVTDVPPA